jgi:hypothetical protein
MADLDLQAIRDEMILVAHEAGAMMLKANPADIGTDNKLNCEALRSVLAGMTAEAVHNLNCKLTMVTQSCRYCHRGRQGY